MSHFIDAYNVDTSNWTRWVNCARSDDEESVEWMYCAGKVFYMTRKDVYPGQELLMYYGDPYAQTLGITYKLRWRQI